MNMLRSTGLTPQKLGNYPSVITAFLTVAENTQPGSTARDQGLADVFRSHQQPYFDQSLLRRLAEIVLPWHVISLPGTMLDASHLHAPVPCKLVCSSAADHHAAARFVPRVRPQNHLIYALAKARNVEVWSATASHAG